jgi:hypothetical protein
MVENDTVPVDVVKNSIRSIFAYGLDTITTIKQLIKIVCIWYGWEIIQNLSRIAHLLAIKSEHMQRL